MSNLPVLSSSINSYLGEINKIQLLTSKEEYDLAVDLQEKGDINAAHKLVVSNLRFVVKVAYEFKNYGLKMSDLIQEGNIGLMQAVKKFDPQKGIRLISYAVWWIRAYIQRYIMKSWSLVKIGTTQAQRKLFFKLREAKEKIHKLLPGTVDNEFEETSISKSLDVSKKEVRDMTSRLISRDVSLNTPMGVEKDSSLIDYLPSKSEDVSNKIIKNESLEKFSNLIKSGVSKLNEREHQLFKKRIHTEEPLTLKDFAEEWGISRERVRQIEVKAKKKLRIHLEENGMTAEL